MDHGLKNLLLNQDPSRETRLPKEGTSWQKTEEAGLTEEDQDQKTSSTYNWLRAMILAMLRMFHRSFLAQFWQ